MKKIMSLILVVAFMLSVAACGTSTAPEPKTKEEGVKEDTKQDETKSEETKEEAKEGKEQAQTEASKTLLDAIKEKGVLVIGTCADYPPYETHVLIDGKDQIVGFDIDIAKEIANELGVELQIEDMDFDGLLVALNAGKVDLVLAGMSEDEERAKSVDFSVVYYNPSQKIVVRKDDVEKFSDLEAFNGKTIGVQKGTIQEGFADENMSGANKVALGKIPNLIIELKSGKSDGIVLEEPVAEAYVSKNPDLAISKVDVVISSDGGSSVAVKKNEKELLDVVNKVIQKLIDDKKIDQFVIEANKLMEQE